LSSVSFWLTLRCLLRCLSTRQTRSRMPCAVVLIEFTLTDLSPPVYHCWLLQGFSLAMVFPMFPNYICHEIDSAVKAIPGNIELAAVQLDW
jgi:hypothetical protein